MTDTAAVTAPGKARRQRSTAAVVTACALIVLLEGYDQSVFGTVLPVLIKDPTWHMDKAQAGYVGSAVFVGMLIGALTASWATRHVPRRTVLVTCLLGFAVFGTACYWAHGPVSLGVLRLLLGIGLGGVLPVTSTLTLGAVDGRRRMLVYSLMFATIPGGGLIAAGLAKVIIPEHGPMLMFLLPLPLVVIALGLALWAIPATTTAPAAATTAVDEAPSIMARGWRTITVLLVLATLFGLLLWYGLLTWLPGILTSAGYDLGSSLTFQVVLLAGGVLGSIALAPVYDRSGGHYGVVAVIYLLGFVVLIASTGSPPQLPLLAFVFVAGATAQGGLITLNGLVDRSYPADARSIALGATLGFGRVGAIIAPSVLGHIVGTSATSSFVFFGVAAALSAVLVAVAGRMLRSRVSVAGRPAPARHTIMTPQVPIRS